MAIVNTYALNIDRPNFTKSIKHTVSTFLLGLREILTKPLWIQGDEIQFFNPSLFTILMQGPTIQCDVRDQWNVTIFFTYIQDPAKTNRDSECHLERPETYVPYSLTYLHDPVNTHRNSNQSHVRKHTTTPSEQTSPGLYRLNAEFYQTFLQK